MLEDLFARLKADMREVVREELREALDGGATPINGQAPKQLAVPADAAAELLGVHVTTLRKWIRAGELPAQRLPGGRKFLIRRADIESFLAARSKGAAMVDGRQRGTGNVDSRLGQILASIDRRK